MIGNFISNNTHIFCSLDPFILTATLDGCCKAYYPWDPEYAACLGGTSSLTQAPIEGWYVQWNDYKCVKNCEVGTDASCGGIRKKWNVLHDTKEVSCCTAI